MLNTWISKTGLVVMAFIFCLLFSGQAIGEDYAEDCDRIVVSTFPGNYKGWGGPEIHSSGVTIVPDGSITLWVDSDGQASPPYNWSVSGLGYSIEPDTTYNDLDNVTLSCGPDIGGG